MSLLYYPPLLKILILYLLIAAPFEVFIMWVSSLNNAKWRQRYSSGAVNSVSWKASIMQVEREN